MRLIDADALMREFAEFVRASNNSDFADVPNWNDAVSLLGSAPTIDPVKHGVWKSKMLDTFRKYEVVCSECGATYIGNYDSYDEPCEFNYCPNCGTRMEDDET